MNVLVFITWPVKAWCIPDAKLAELRAEFPDVNFLHAPTRDDVPRLIGDADAAFTPHLTAEWVLQAPRLRWVHSPAAAVHGLLPLHELERRDIILTNSRAIQAIPMAEHVMGGLLMLARKLHVTRDAQHEHRWIQNDLVNDWPRTLHGMSMTIVGLGGIGTEIARRAHAFGVQVTGVRRHPERERLPFVNRVVGTDDLDFALAGCDLLVLAAPAGAATDGLITAERMALLNRGALIANVARAQILDEQALTSALASGQIGGAMLDVFDREPLDASSPWWTMPNVIVTPHSSGFRAEHWDEIMTLFQDNLARFLRGDTLLNLVDLEAGY